MPGEPFRFLHASELRLDVPLAGVGPLERDDRIVAEDATLTSLERLTDGCLEHGAEFLLLTGDTFGVDFPSLRSRHALLTTFETLREFEIQVFWETDRKRMSELLGDAMEAPANLVPVYPENADPVAVVRQGRVIASVASAGGHADRDASDTLERHDVTAFRIALANAAWNDDFVTPAGHDYLACHGTARRATRQSESCLAHDPGPIQGVTGDQTGSHGATLVDVDKNGAARLTFVPTAPVRWDRLLVGVDRDLTLERLAERMQAALLELEIASGEQLWIVNWQLIGRGDLFDELQTGEAADELRASVDRGLAGGREVRRVDRFHFRRRLDQHADELTGQIESWINCDTADPVNRAVDELPAQMEWPAELQQRLTGIDTQRVRDSATRLCQELLMSTVDTANLPDEMAR